MRSNRPAPVVVTDLREPLTSVHRRMIRTRTALLAVWILGWVATGFVADTAWLAIAVLVVTGPVLWVAVWWFESRRRPGRRTPVGRPAIQGRAAPGAGSGR